jgi:predicted nucleic acid-binding protein
VLAAYYAPEALSVEAQLVLRTFPCPAVSELTEVELASALARKVRQRELAAADAEQARALFTSHLESGFYRRIPLDRPHFRLARGWMTPAGPPLKSLDALHLAVASLAGLTLATADRQLATAAEALRVRVLRVEEGVGLTVHDG